MEYVVDKEMAEGGAFVPVDGPANRGGSPPTKVDACPPFLVVHNPMRWTVLGGRVVPQFGRLPLVGGLNGCDETRNKVTGALVRVNSAYARGDLQDRGKVIIPPDAIPDSHVRPGWAKSYLWNPKGRPDVNLLIYTKCFPGTAEVEIDEVRYLEWVDWLIETKVIEPAPTHVLRRMRAKKQSERDALADRAQTVPSLKKLVTLAEAEIEAIDAEIGRRTPKAEEQGESVNLGEHSDSPPPKKAR